MRTLLTCAYNMDDCCVELKFTDGSMIAIDTIAVENEIEKGRLSFRLTAPYNEERKQATNEWAKKNG